MRTWAKPNPAWRGSQLWGGGPVAQSRAAPSSAGRRLRLQQWPVTNMSTAPHTSRVPPMGTVPCHAHSGLCGNTVTTRGVWRNTSDPGRGSTSMAAAGGAPPVVRRRALEMECRRAPSPRSPWPRGSDAGAGRGRAGCHGPGQQPLDVSGSESRIWGGVTAVRSGGPHAGSSMGDSSPGDHDGEMYVTQSQDTAPARAGRCGAGHGDRTPTHSRPRRPDAAGAGG